MRKNTLRLGSYFGDFEIVCSCIQCLLHGPIDYPLGCIHIAIAEKRYFFCNKTCFFHHVPLHHVLLAKLLVEIA